MIASRLAVTMLKPAAGRPPLYLSLEPMLRCPNRRCGLTVYTNTDLAVLQCQNKHCRAKWWATRLQAGDIRSQIRADFDGNEMFVHLLDRLGAPERIDQPMYWQVWLSGPEFQSMEGRLPGRLLERSHALIRWLATGLPPDAR